MLIAILAITHSTVARPQERASYPDTESGLQRLIEEILGASKKGDNERFDALLESLVIPEYETWFAQTFGDVEAAALAQNYRAARAPLLERYRKQFGELARIKKPHLEIEKHSEASQVRVEFWRAVLKAANGRTALYDASYKKGRDSYGLGYFFYVDGGFRLIDNLIMSVLSTAPPMRVRIGGNVQQAKLISQPLPTYPEAAKAQLIQGTVRLEVIIARDGSIMQLEVLSGDPILAEAALAAVRQWRYQPTLLNGVPVEVVSIIEVAFSFQR